MKIKGLLGKLNDIQERNMSSIPTKDDLVLEKQVSEKLLEVLKQEEIKWAKKAQTNWLQIGDKNTKFFQTFVNIRRKRNEI